MKKPLTVVLVVFIILTVAAGIYYYFNPPKKTQNNDARIDLTTVECSRVPNNLKNCPAGYFCNESISGGLGPDGGIPIEHAGGDNKCYKICKSDSDCSTDAPYCTKIKVMIEDYSKAEMVCQQHEDCAGQGKAYYKNVSPLYCCSGLDNVLKLGYISIADKCYFYSTNTYYGDVIGYCSDCGNGVCEDIESICSCPGDCIGKEEPNYKTIQDFCTNYWNTNEDLRTSCKNNEAFKDKPICDLCV